jgi:hypothetical protein
LKQIKTKLVPTTAGLSVNDGRLQKQASGECTIYIAFFSFFLFSFFCVTFLMLQVVGCG